MHHRDNDTGPRDRFRNAMTAKIGPRYRPGAHLGVTILLCASAAAVGIFMTDRPNTGQLLCIAPMLAFLNVFEWFFHRYLMHRRWPWAGIYRRHTLEHHRLYRWGDMGVRDRRELYYVLMPTPTIVGFVITASAFTAAARALFGPNIAWIFLATSGLYVLAYELTHLAYHMPKGHWVRSLPFVELLAEHHSRHHEPKLMQAWNFNITVPFADLLFRTMAPKSLVDRVREGRDRRSR